MLPASFDLVMVDALNQILISSYTYPPYIHFNPKVRFKGKKKKSCNAQDSNTFTPTIDLKPSLKLTPLFFYKNLLI